MRIKITDKKSKLKVGQVYDLWEVSALNLIRKDYAVKVEDDNDCNKQSSGRTRKS